MTEIIGADIYYIVLFEGILNEGAVATNGYAEVDSLRRCGSRARFFLTNRSHSEHGKRRLFDGRGRVCVIVEGQEVSFRGVYVSFECP